MRTVEGLVDANGNLGKILIALKGGEEILKEYTKDEESAVGNTFKTYVLTAPGDIISVDITADANTADVFDLEVDGIVRASVSSKSLAKAFHGTIGKVCHKGKSGNRRGGAKYCGMQVKRRDASLDATFSWDSTPSAVSSLVIKAWRKDPNAEAQGPVTKSVIEATPSIPQIPTYEEYASWQEFKGYISKEGPKPPFEIDFINQTILGKNQKEKIDEIRKRKPKDYSLFATFVFNLQSKTNLTALGFEGIPTYTPAPPPGKPLKVKKPSKAKKSHSIIEGDADDEDKSEDDNASIAEDDEEEQKKEKEQLVVSEIDSKSKSKPESKPKSESKSTSEPMPKSKKPREPLPDFGPPKKSEDVVNGLLKAKSKPKANSEKSIHKRETGKSLHSSCSEMFSAEYGATAGDSQNLLPEQVVEEASASTPEVAQESGPTDNSEVPNLPNAAPQSLLKESGDGENVESKAEGNGSLTKSTAQKGSVLQGEKGNPAHRAFIARADTQETESRAESQVDPSEMIDETETSTGQAIEALNCADGVILQKDANRYLIPEYQDLTTATLSDPIQSPEYEPLTPPVSAKKAVPQRSLETAITHRLDMASQTLLPDQLAHPSQLVSHSKPSTFSQATTTSTQGGPSQWEESSINKQQDFSFNQTTTVIDESPMHASGFVRATSPVFSEATEVADPMEIMESVRNSQRISDSNNEFQYQYAQSNPHQNVCLRSEYKATEAAYHTIASPILGSAKNTTEDGSMLDIESGDVREQVRESWKRVSPTPTSSLNSPQPPNQNRGQHSRNQSFGDFMSKVQGVSAEKRKADTISGSKKAESEMPRKTTIAPAGRKREALEEMMMVAKAKLAAASEKNRKLEERRQAALLVKKKSDEVEVLLRKVEEMEQTNVKLEAEIVALLDSGDDE